MVNQTQALPYFDVQVNQQPLKQYATSVQIIQQTNAHPIAILEVSYIGQGSAQGTLGVRTSWAYIKEQTPIVINFGMRPVYLSQFLGYVASYKVINTQS
jgi:hypothetical protein